MPIQFQKLPQQTLDVSSGQLSGAPPKPVPVDIGMDRDELTKQVTDLASKKVPVEKAMQAIDQHPEITDKGKAKSMAQAIYAILGK